MDSFSFAILPVYNIKDGELQYYMLPEGDANIAGTSGIGDENSVATMAPTPVPTMNTMRPTRFSRSRQEQVVQLCLFVLRLFCIASYCDLYSGRWTDLGF